MSHFRAVKTKLKDTESLIEALKSMGLEPELYGKATADNKQCQKVKNYYHYQEKQLSSEIVLGDIIVRRDQIQDYASEGSKALDDLGFTWNEKSEVYDIAMSDSDSFVHWQFGDVRVNGAAEFTKLLFQRYSFYQAHKIARSVGGSVQIQQLEGGRRQFTISPGAATKSAQLATRR